MSDESEKNSQEASVEAPAPAIEPLPVSEPAPVSVSPSPESVPAFEPQSQPTQTTTVVGSNEVSSPPSFPAPENPIPGLLAKAKAVLFSRKQKKLEKILKLAVGKRKIANDDVQKLLRISDATATRYLSQLVKEGKIKRSGLPNNAFYEPIQ